MCGSRSGAPGGLRLREARIMWILRARTRVAPRVRALVLGGTIAAVWAPVGLLGIPAAAAAPGSPTSANAPRAAAAAKASIAPAEPCSALTGLSLPGLPGSDTATVTANEVA